MGAVGLDDLARIVGKCVGVHVKLREMGMRKGTVDSHLWDTVYPITLRL